MPNLIVEYQKRHRNSSIPISHDALCFFNQCSEPALIAMTSLACRSFATCGECDKRRPNVIVELFQPGYAGMFLMSRHEHVDPCIDLLEYVHKLDHRQLTPFMAKKPRDLELWLWNFTARSRPRTFRPVEDNKELQAIEHMFWSAVKQPKLYNAYYIAYEAFLPKRAYLLYE